MTCDPIIGLVVDGPYFELHGLETAEGFLDQAKLFVGSGSLASSHLLFGHLTTYDVTAVEELFGHDLFWSKLQESRPSITSQRTNLPILERSSTRPTRAPSVLALARRFEAAILSSSTRVRCRSRSRVLPSRPAVSGLRHRQ